MITGTLPDTWGEDYKNDLADMPRFTTRQLSRDKNNRLRQSKVVQNIGSYNIEQIVKLGNAIKHSTHSIANSIETHFVVKEYLNIANKYGARRFREIPPENAEAAFMEAMSLAVNKYGYKGNTSYHG